MDAPRSCGLLVALCCCAPAAVTAAEWSVSAASGSAWNLKTRLQLEQESFSTISLSAEYDTRPWTEAPYYALRVSRHDDTGAWEASFIHHKLYLENPPPEVGDFSVSHGFNIFTVNRAWRLDALTYRLGAGVVVTHVDATVRGASYDGPYELSGVSLLGGVSKRYNLRGPWFVAIEALTTVSYAQPSPDGSPGLRADITNVAVHGHLAAGFDF